MAQANLRGRPPQSFFADTIRLEYAENTGGFLGLGDSLPEAWRNAVFTIGCTVGLAAIIAFTLLASRMNAIQILSLSLISAGGLGNLIDRWVCNGHVRDFLNLGVGSLRTGIFNVADAALMAGCFLLLLAPRFRPSPGGEPSSQDIEYDQRP